MYQFKQVDVFSGQYLKGNPLAVVFCEENIPGAGQMQAFARWTGLSETAFILPPLNASADYRVRIFTPFEELPFAGHPTLGACHCWLNVRRRATVIQESAIGLTRIEQEGNRLFFEAPPLLQNTPFSQPEQEMLIRATGLRPQDIIRSAVLSNGPVWHCAQLSSVEMLMAMTPDYRAMQGLKIGLCALADDGVLEVRAFIGNIDAEDPVTGSLNAVLAQWLITAGEMPDVWRVRQGMKTGADGEIFIKSSGDRIMVGGVTREVITGTVSL